MTHCHMVVLSDSTQYYLQKKGTFFHFFTIRFLPFLKHNESNPETKIHTTYPEISLEPDGTPYMNSLALQPSTRSAQSFMLKAEF